MIRFDNRDCGLSTHLATPPYPVVQAMADRLAGRQPPPAPYSVVDMADDAFAVLDAEGVGSVHVMGASMGGMIAQVMAIEHPERTRSLISVMSSTGEPEYGQGTPSTLAALLGPPPTDRGGVRRAPAAHRTRRGDQDPCRRRPHAGSCVDGFRPSVQPGGLVAAVRGAVVGARTGRRPPQFRVPVLVVHGAQDTLVGPSGGERTAELVPGARLLVLEEAGHDLPVVVWPRLVDAIAELVSGVERERQAAG